MPLLRCDVSPSTHHLFTEPSVCLRCMLMDLFLLLTVSLIYRVQPESQGGQRRKAECPLWAQAQGGVTGGSRVEELVERW